MSGKNTLKPIRMDFFSKSVQLYTKTPALLICPAAIATKFTLFRGVQCVERTKKTQIFVCTLVTFLINLNFNTSQFQLYHQNPQLYLKGLNNLDSKKTPFIKCEPSFFSRDASGFFPSLQLSSHENIFLQICHNFNLSIKMKKLSSNIGWSYYCWAYIMPFLHSRSRTRRGRKGRMRSRIYASISSNRGGLPVDGEDQCQSKSVLDEGKSR